ncbi:hypothetical protein ACFX18_09090 [Lactococcus garvieae]|uniref:hypothetical protein n=1 Tax=Lactococcus garvieae TaxID=1363 RepID=UPI003D16F6EC
MKLGKYNLRTVRKNNIAIILCTWEERQATSRKIIFFTENTERKHLVITKEIVDRYRVKQEIKQANKKMNSPQGLHLLVDMVEKDIQKSCPGMSWGEWSRVCAYEAIYDIAFSRGVKQERNRRKQRDNIGALTGNDIAELARALCIDINKLNTAVLELAASRKAM